MPVRFFLFVILGTILVVVGCAPRVAKPARVETVSIFVSGDLNLAELSTLTRLVAQTKGERPCLWLVAGEVFDEKIAALIDGEEIIDLLSFAGVDAVLLTAGWLKFGVERIKQLVDRAQFRVLGYNITDTFDLPVAHPWMIKKLGGIDFAIGGLFSDSTSFFLNLKGLKFTPTGYAGQKLLILLRGKGDLTALMGSDFDRFSCFDLIFNHQAGQAVRYDIAIVNSKIYNVKKEVVSFEGVEPELKVARLVDSLRLVLDSISARPIVETRVKIPPRVLTRAIVEGYLALREVDGFIYDSSGFVRDTVLPGKITRLGLIRALTEPGRLVLVNLEGQEINRLLKGNKRLALETRTGIRGRRIMARKIYRVAMTPGTLTATPELRTKRFEFSARQLWEYAADILQAQGRR